MTVRKLQFYLLKQDEVFSKEKGGKMKRKLKSFLQT
jgi:hypothetical protein